jgi:hypothetical protein
MWLQVKFIRSHIYKHSVKENKNNLMLVGPTKNSALAGFGKAAFHGEEPLNSGSVLFT